MIDKQKLDDVTAQIQVLGDAAEALILFADVKLDKPLSTELVNRLVEIAGKLLEVTSDLEVVTNDPFYSHTETVAELDAGTYAEINKALASLSVQKLDEEYLNETSSGEQL